MSGRYWKALLVVLALSVQPTNPTGCGTTGGRCPSRRNTMTAAVALAVALAPSCEHNPAAALSRLEAESAVMLQVPSADRNGATETVPASAVLATIRHAIRGYQDHGRAFVQDSSLAAAIGNARCADSISDLIRGGGRVDDFLVHVKSGAFRDGQVPIGIFLEGLHSEEYSSLSGHATWSHSYRFIARRRSDGSWDVTRKGGFTS